MHQATSTRPDLAGTNATVPQRSKIERAAVGALKKMKVKIECRWFDYGSDDGDECVRLILFRDDIEITVGPYTVNAQSSRMPMNGLFVRTPAGERHWYWDEVRAWLTGRSLPPLKGA